MVEKRLLPSDYLERGWCQGVLRDKDGKMCMMGAISMWDTGSAIMDRALTPKFHEFVRALNLEDGLPEFAVVPWNNAPERTQAEVVARAKMAEVKLGLRPRCLAMVEDPDEAQLEPEPEVVARLRDGLAPELALVN